MKSSYDVTFYQIQFCVKDRSWRALSYDRCDTQPTRLYPEPYSVTNGFHPSGECWQITRHHGTFDLDYAKECLEAVREKDTDGWSYRIIRVELKQDVHILCEEHWEKENE